MSTDITADEPQIFYPDSDGKPMADNSLQLDWILKILGELRDQFVGQNVCVAGNLFWYPVKDQPTIVVAPDVFVAFGRPQVYRGSYQQWLEDGIAPQVVFEILSPGNTQDEMDDKLDFYDRHGVEEYYFIDPFEESFICYTRRRGRLTVLHVRDAAGVVSPRLGIRLVSKDGFKIFTPEGREFQAREERIQELLAEADRSQADLAAERERSDVAAQRAEAADRRAEAERQKAEVEKQRADAEKQRADAEKQRADAERMAKERIAAKLRELGGDPDTVS